MPKFTVVIPTHDHADTLFWSIASVQAQTRQDFELFIVGDGVTDHTREIVGALVRQDRRLRFFDNPKGPRRGEIHRHKALQEAQGELICYQCDDDWWLPDHLETLEGLLADHDLAHTMQIEIAADGGAPQTWFFNAQLPAQVAAMRRNETGFGTATAGHTAAAYRALPWGWRTTPTGHNVDLYMWLQFLDQPGCRVASWPRPTVVRFSALYRQDWTIPQRVAEMAAWMGRLTAPAERLALQRAALEPLCARTYADKVKESARANLLASALQTCHPDPLPRLAQEERSKPRGTPYKAGKTLTFQEGGTGLAYLASGFSWPEPWGIWTGEPTAAIVLPLEQPLIQDARLIVHYTVPFIPKHHERMRVVLSVNGVGVDDWDDAPDGQPNPRIVPLPASLLRGASQVTIFLQMEHPIRPIDFGLNGDQRLLGLGLISLSLEPAA